MARKKKQEEAPEGSERWLITYADMITLLMVMFVVFFAMATVDLKKFKAAAQSLKEGFGASRPEAGKAQAAATEAVPVFEIPGGDTPLEGVGSGAGGSPIDIFEFPRITRQLEEEMKSLLTEGMFEGASVSIDYNQRGIVITVSPDNILFDSGKATLKPEFKQILDVLGPTLLKIPNRIQVEGHTDSVPINTAVFPSNWELSTARASGVLRYLVSRIGIPSERLCASGYADSHPIATNATSEGKARNRRVEIVILRSEPGKDYIAFDVVDEGVSDFSEG
ncbi:flagellar motor protein MotB [bacterium]|nr:flagellar motor protein MotB [bacterium]